MADEFAVPGVPLMVESSGFRVAEFSQRIRVAMFVASLLATSGSVMAKAGGFQDAEVRRRLASPCRNRE
ncbi:hypothetical protein [Nocardia nova]|uniref:hypothetical protein n=1 Tax=Nocardia nova TaxID=37330 RepID=UPI0011B0584E|nr:hypothetical protein [Nocardia nova]